MILDIINENIIHDVDYQVKFDEDISSNIDDIEYKFGFDFLGMGDNAIVFSIGDGLVLKITSSKDDFDHMNALAGIKMPGVIDVKASYKGRYNDLYYIITKEYNSLPPKWRYALKTSVEAPIQHYVGEPLGRDDYIYLSNNFHIPLDQVARFFKSFNAIEAHGIHVTDLKADNFLWDGDTESVVLIDFSDKL